MKKSNLFLVTLMALIVMSCSKDETTMSIPQEGNAIEFGTYVGRDAQTRALSVETPALLASGGGFGVFAYYTGQNVYGGTAIKPNFMYNQGVTSADAGATWTYSPVKYWPNNVDDKVSFFAYAPFGNTNVTVPLVDAFTAGDPTITFAVNGAAKQQVDLLYADATENMKNRIKNGTTAANKIGVNEKITFKFKHALARIGFNVEALVDQVNGNETGGTDSDATTGTIPTDTKIVVTKVELIGSFYPSGTLNLNNTVANTPIWTPGTAAVRTFELTPTENFVSAVAYGETGNQTTGQLVTSATAKQKLNNDASYLMVIPQNFDGSGTDVATKIKVKVTYDVITKDTFLDTGQSKITNAITSDAFKFNFAAGKAYTFNLHLGMTSVKFDADVADWVDGTPSEIVVNVPINN